MKRSIILAVAMLTGAGILSCKKERPKAPNVRTVKFKLYTAKDFSDDNNNITFSIFVRSGNNTLFDSTVVTMKVKDIPNNANALMYEKKIFNNYAILIAGFRYIVENVGTASHADTISANEQSKLIDYDFR